MKGENTILQVVTTVDSAEAVRKIASAVVERRLAACAQIDGPMQSIYRWKGEVTESPEFRLTMKTSVAAGEDLIGALEELHPYDLPEIVVGRLEASADYAHWIDENTGSRNHA